MGGNMIRDARQMPCRLIPLLKIGVSWTFIEHAARGVLLAWKASAALPP
jgi:hypothetical protein